VTLGGLVGRVGGSLVGERLAGLTRSQARRRVKRSETLVRNALRIATTLGELKGAAMKVGQMLSLHERLLPAEAAAILASLQQRAPSIPFETMQHQLRGELPDYDRLFRSLDPEPYAAASIGQVHVGVLRDGRRVAVKIQYPEIDRIVRADLRNLRHVLQALFGLVSGVDFRPIWRELRARLLEELDYLNEAANMKRMTALHWNVPEIIVPGVVDEATTRRVLTMELTRGIPPERAATERYSRRLRDRWGRALFEFQFRGLFEHRFLHADPNIANFAFRRDGRLIVYDYGCMKEIPAWLAEGYAELIRAALAGDREGIPEALRRMHVHLGRGIPLPRSLTDPYLELFSEILRAYPPYTFGGDPGFYQRAFQLGLTHLPEGRRIRFPEGVVYVDRCLVGHFGNLARREILARYTRVARGE
jgi:predicted unusual protein kinase regulating ubiquinone biosynthesis (AarF/ABC1/UbiB family)